MPRRLGVLVAIVAFAASASPAIALSVPVNAPLTPPFAALDQAIAAVANDAAQIIAIVEATLGGVTRTVATVGASDRALSYTAAAAATVSSPATSSFPTLPSPQPPQPVTPVAAVAQGAQPPTPTVSGYTDAALSARFTSLAQIVGNVLALLPTIENQQPQSDTASVQSQIDALSHEIAQTNQINNLSNVTLTSPTFTSSSGGTGLSTSQVSEGSNLYFTNARVASYIDSSSTIPSAAGGSLGNVLEWNGSNWTSLATSSLGLGSGGSPTWGSITGTLANQTDLQSALNAKLSTTSLPAITALGNLASVGTITSGTWQGSPIAAAFGGTGWATISAGSILFGNGASALATSSNLYWDNADGRLGIGTTSPTATLTLDSSSPNGTIMRVSNSSTGGHIYDWLSTGSSNTGGAGRLDLFDYTEGIARLSVASNGNVGIGSTSPVSLLSVAGNTYLGGNLTTTGTAAFSKTVNTSGTTGGYDIDGNLILQASSTIYSTLLGQGAGLSLTTGTGNTASGYGALSTATSSPYNTAYGYDAMNAFQEATPGDGGATGNMTAFGAYAMANSIFGYINSAYGFESLYNSTSTVENSCFGWSSCLSVNNALGNGNGSYNAAFGAGALWHDPSGSNNVAMGSDTMRNTNGAFDNVALGGAALRNGTYSFNVGVGFDALHGQGWYDNETATSTGSDNTMVGTLAMSTTSWSTAHDDTGAGFETAENNETGNYNVSMGALSFLNATSSSNDVAIGYGSQEDSVSVSNTGNNTSVGYESLSNDSSGTYNVAFGANALLDDTTGGSNVGVGADALYSDSSGVTNDALGLNASEYNQNGSSNVALGTSALLYNVSGNRDTAVGYQAGLGQSGQSINYETLGGYDAGYSLGTGGDGNTFFGYQAASTTNTGAYNIALGYNIDLPLVNGSNQLDIGNLIYGTGINGTYSTPSTGNVGIGTTSPQARLEIWGADTNGTTTAFLVSNNASTSEFSVYDDGNATLAGSLVQNSDIRLKTNIQGLDGSSSLAEIEALNPVTFNWIDPAKSSVPQFGFIAQQVQQVFPNLVSTTSPTALTPDGTLSLNYIDLISPIVSAIQQLDSEITSLASTVAGFAQSFTTQQLCVSNGPNDPNPVCVTKSQLAALLASANQSDTPPDSSQASSPSTSAATDTPDSTSSPQAPVIQINGDNPAVVQVGTTYNDLGATITGPQADLNLGIETYLNGAPVSSIEIDTSAAATDTIDYVVTDQTGLTSTSTRTVIVDPAATPTSATSTSATSTVSS
jgi:trimeric autotransporter adhesin